MKSGRHMKKAEGGKVMGDERDHPVPPDARTKAMVAREREGQKHGGKVTGAASKPRLDKRARGGRMTPKSPFSGAGDMAGPGKSYESKLDHIDTGGKGTSQPHP